MWERRLQRKEQDITPVTPGGGVVPHAHRAVLAGRYDDWNLGVEQARGDICLVAGKHLQTRLGLVVPDSDCVIVRARHQQRPVTSSVVRHGVDSLLMTFESEVGLARAQAPNFYALVKGRAGKIVRVLGVECAHHNVMYVPVKYLSVFESGFVFP